MSDGKSAKSANRLRLAVLTALALAVALGSFWLLRVMQRQGEEHARREKPNDPDYFVEKFSFVRMSKSGQARYTISGDRLVHLPVDDVSEIQKPVVQHLTPGAPPMTVRAERAKIEHASEKVWLSGNVTITRPASAERQSLHVATEALLVVPENDTMSSDLAVEIRLGASVLTGVGMSANNSAREFQVHSKVRGVLPPAAPR